MNIRAIITDYGGVLIKMVDETPRRLLSEKIDVPLNDIYHLVFNTESAIQAALGEITSEEHWENIRAALKLPTEQLPGFMTQFWSADGLNNGLIDTLISLRSRYKIGLLSNAADDLRGMLVNRWKIDHVFDDMVISAEVHLAKPDERIYRLACARLDVQPGEVVFIDDLSENIEGARRAGLQAVRYQSNEQVMEEIGELIRSL